MKNTLSAAQRLRLVVAASAAGTTFDWYDFFLAVPLASLIAKLFFAGLDEATAYLFALGSFAAGFAFRPLGAILFGRMGDRLGRKSTFLVTISLMGGATFAIGLLPTMASAGMLAPTLFVLLRIAQGLALGGEWGGAAIYIAEHAPHDRRGYLTSWMGPAAAFGLGLALVVTLAVRTLTGEPAFAAWGWRVPFLLSGVLFILSVWIRLKLHESPLFTQLLQTGSRSAAPLREAFGQWSGIRVALVALLSMMIAQGAVWFTTFLYTQSFLERVLKVPPSIASALMLGLVTLSVPLYLFFGWLSDRIGRKPVMLGGILLATFGIFPVFEALRPAANPALAAAVATQAVVVRADPADCHPQFDPVASKQASTPCDTARALLAKRGIPYTRAALPAGAPVVIHIGAQAVAVAALDATLNTAGYPLTADPSAIHLWRVFLLLSVLVVAATALYGPQAACLVELFPTRIRYTARSLPYHIGTGWVGGMLPAAAYALTVASGDSFFGLWYPVLFCALAAIVMALFLPETRHRQIHLI